MAAEVRAVQIRTRAQDVESEFDKRQLGVVLGVVLGYKTAVLG